MAEAASCDPEFRDQGRSNGSSFSEEISIQLVRAARSRSSGVEEIGARFGVKNSGSIVIPGGIGSEKGDQFSVKGLTIGRRSPGSGAGEGVGALLGEDWGKNKVVGGEVRYLVLFDGLKVSQGGTQATMTGHSQLIHYDVLFHARPPGSPVRP